MTQDEAERLSALLQQGLALHQTGWLAEAAVFYTQVLECFPDHPDTLDLYGAPLKIPAFGRRFYRIAVTML
jgi:hypothetical protein